MTIKNVLLVTHSSRPFMEARAHFNAFESRFAGRSLKERPVFESLQPIEKSVPFDGQLTLWRVPNASQCDGRNSLRLIGRYDPGYAVNSATFAGEHLVVCGADRVELLDPDFNVTATIRDPWIASCHTVVAESQRYVWLSSAPANAALRVDLLEQRVVEGLVILTLYGFVAII